jgi:signal transduction histidine kinase
LKKRSGLKNKTILGILAAIGLLAVALVVIMIFFFQTEINAAKMPLSYNTNTIRWNVILAIFAVVFVLAAFTIFLINAIVRFISEPLKVIYEIEQIAMATREGKLTQRMELSGMEGDYLKMISGMNGALDVICFYLNAIPVALALFNEEMKMLYRNYAMEEFLLMHDISGFDKELLMQIAGSGSYDSEDDLDPRAAAVFDPALTNPVPFITDIALLGHDGGSNFNLTLQRITIDDARRGSACVLLLLGDVTMLTRARIDAEMASRTKSDFLSRMSHEIRTPMNAVIGMTHIARNSDDIERIRSCLDQVENSSNHLLGIINDVLDFSKMESNKLFLDISEFSLLDNLNFVVSMMYPKAKEKNINIRLSSDDIKNDGISADSLRLNQVLINLLSNAVKFSSYGSDVFLNVRELGSENGFSSYSFEIIDSGIGISEYQASKLFRPFEQADGSITRNYGGTGLGLAISKNLVEMMGGKITLDSKEGEGSTFTFTIHCASKPVAEKKGQEEVVQYGGETYDFKGKRCLVADDIEINREIIIELLSSTNIQLEPAENGKEALEKFTSFGEGYFDIILMDMQMPVLDGCRATAEIRRLEKKWAEANKNYREIPIVAMTANVMQEDIQMALSSGMNAHLRKPIELETTLRVINEQLTKKR